MNKMNPTNDLVAAAYLVERSVRSGNRAGIATTVVVSRRTYSTDQNDVWNAITTAERIGRWFGPIEGDLKVGGRFQIQDNASGTVEQCTRPESFTATWEFDGNVSWIDVRLTPAERGTTLELRHEAPVDPEGWRQFGPGATGVGWDLGWLGLELHLDATQSVDRQWTEEFPLTQPGAEFVRRSAFGWAEAAVEHGDAKEQAIAAAERTTDFYTTDPDAAPES